MLHTDHEPLVDSADARLSAARAFLATVPVLAEYLEQLAAVLTLTEAQRQRLAAGLAPHAERLEALHVSALVKQCTAAEIRALTEFQATALGRSIMRKQAAIQTDLQPTLVPLLQAVVTEALRTAPERP